MYRALTSPLPPTPLELGKDKQQQQHEDHGVSSLQVRAEDQKSGKETSSPAKPNIEMVRCSDWGSNWGSDCGSVWGRAWDALAGWAGLLLVVPSTSSYTYVYTRDARYL